MAIVKVSAGNYAYKVKYRGFDGKLKSKYKSGFSTIKSCRKAEEAFLLSTKEHDDEITFEELVMLFNERSSSMNIKESTIVGYEVYYKNHLKDFFGPKKISKISVEMIEQWKTEMIKKRMPNGKEYSASTINHAMNVLSKYLSYAEKLSMIQMNPCRKVSRYVNHEEIISKSNEEKNFWENDDFKTFISYVEDQYWNLVFTFLYETGVREGEMFALTWNDVDFNKGTISINKSITSKTHQNRYKITTPKNSNSYRTIDLSDSFLKRLKNHYERQKNKDGYNDSYFVFGDIRPLSRSSLARYLDKYIKVSGVKRITPHGFRHSHATFLISNRVDDTLIAERLGHTVNELRKTYAHVYKSMRNDMKNKLNELYSE